YLPFADEAETAIDQNMVLIPNTGIVRSTGGREDAAELFGDHGVSRHSWDAGNGSLTSTLTNRMWLERDDTKRKADQSCNRTRRCGMPADRARLWSRRPDDRR